MAKFEAMINKWCEEAGQGVHIDYEQKEPQIEITKLDASNPFWLPFKEAIQKLYATCTFIPKFVFEVE